jgi:HEAT repeat protein
VRDAAREAAAKLGHQAVRPLIACLAADDPEVAAGAAAALGVTGDRRALSPLADALHHEDYHVRLSATEALGRLRDAGATESLLAVLRDPDYRVADAAATALPQLEQAPVEGLVAALDDSARNVRQRAVRALGEIADPRTREPLIIALEDADMDVRGWAAIGLARIPHVRSVEALISALGDGARPRVRAAERALRSLTGADLGPDAGVWRTWWEENRDEYLRRGLLSAAEESAEVGR